MWCNPFVMPWNNCLNIYRVIFRTSALMASFEIYGADIPNLISRWQYYLQNHNYHLQVVVSQRLSSKPQKLIIPNRFQAVLSFFSSSPRWIGPDSFQTGIKPDLVQAENGRIQIKFVVWDYMQTNLVWVVSWFNQKKKREREEEDSSIGIGI